MTVSITKPTSGQGPGWGTTLNTALDAIVTEVNSFESTVSATFVPLTQLAATPDLMASGAVSHGTSLGSSGAATGFNVVWPGDGATGVYTGTESTVTPGAVDSYTVTHVLVGVTKTYTQPAVTRDPSSGAVTNRPAITVA